MNIYCVEEYYDHQFYAGMITEGMRSSILDKLHSQFCVKDVIGFFIILLAGGDICNINAPIAVLHIGSFRRMKLDRGFGV